MYKKIWEFYISFLNIQIINYAENKKEFLANKFGITKIPSKAALSRILNMVDAGKIVEIITGIMKESIEDTGNVVAADGKAIHEKTNEPLVFQKMIWRCKTLYGGKHQWKRNGGIYSS